MTAYSFLSTYPPTRCGLATFTEALASAIAEDGPRSRIVRMMDELAQPAPAAIRTKSTIVAELGSVGPAGDPAIRHAASMLSHSDVAIVQHEFGIFGGPDGSDVIRVLEQLTVPSIVVLHTVLDVPTAGQRAVLERVGELAEGIVVMTETALHRLAGYAVNVDKVSVIPHGVPSWSLGRRHTSTDRRVVLTWGLLGPGKGIEHGIRAMAHLGDIDPSVHYVVSGQTHPKVLAQDGEAYRDSLHALVAELGLTDRVSIEGEYLDAGRLAERVGSADVVLLPYDSRSQVTSGVLVEALAAGKPVVATAFPHAIELLAGEAGTVVEHGDPRAIATGLRAALARSGVRRAPTAAAGASWPEVASHYRQLARRLTAAPAEVVA